MTKKKKKRREKFKRHSVPSVPFVSACSCRRLRIVTIRTAVHAAETNVLGSEIPGNVHRKQEKVEAFNIRSTSPSTDITYILIIKAELELLSTVNAKRHRSCSGGGGGRSSSSSSSSSGGGGSSSDVPGIPLLRQLYCCLRATKNVPTGTRSCPDYFLYITNDTPTYHGTTW